MEVGEFSGTDSARSHIVLWKGEQGFRRRQIVSKEGFETIYYGFSCFDVQLLVEDGGAQRVKAVVGRRVVFALILGQQVVRVDQV